MADDKTPDKFAAIIDYCLVSSSQDEILTHSNFAGEIEVVSREGRKSTVERDSGGSHEKSKAGDETIEKRESGEFVSISADCEERENLGFRKRSLIDGGSDGNVKLDARIELGSEELGEKEGESPLKKTRVLSNSVEIETPSVVVQTDLKVKVSSPLNRVVLESGQCSEKLGPESGNEKLAEAYVESSGKTNLESENKAKNMENDGVDLVEKESCDKNREGELNGSDKGKDDGASHISRMQGKRELPRSLLGHVWGTTVEGDERGRNGGLDGSTTRKDGLDEVKADVTEKGKSEGDRIVRNVFDVLRILAIESRYSESVEIDIFETAKRRGMMFPRSRFRKDMN